MQETLPYIGEIMLFAGNFAPQGWAMCDGQILAIAPNQALFSLLGTAYGGNGTTTFALPDLRGRSPLHWGQGAGLSNRVRGEQGGEVDHTLTLAELPAHTHAVRGSASDGTSASPAGTYIARNAASIPLYAATANDDGGGCVLDRRRRPATPEPAARPGAELHHRAPGHLSEPIG